MVEESPSRATQDPCSLDQTAYVPKSISSIKCGLLYGIQGIMRIKGG